MKPSQNMGYSKYKILIISPVHFSLLKKLKKNFNVTYEPKISYKKLEKNVNDKTLIILRSGIKIDKNIIDKSKMLRFIVRAGTGLDNIDVKYAKNKSIKVFNFPNLNSTAVAELTFGLIIALYRHIVTANNELKKNIWNKQKFYGNELKNKVLGLIGLGSIGTAIARLAKGFSLYVIANVKNKNKKRGKSIKIVSLRYLLQKSDIIVLCLPLTKETKNLIDNKMLKLIKKNGILINLSRGGIINENHLYKILKEKQIFGAATDVLENEGKKNKLFKLKNIIVTPHIGAMTNDTQIAIAKKVYKLVRNLL